MLLGSTRNVISLRTLCVSCLCLVAFFSPKKSFADDRKSARDLIKSRGFNVAEFELISQNYILKVYRVINPLADPETVHKIPVLLTHGILWDITNMLSSSKNSRPRKPYLNERVTLYAMENGTEDRGLHFYLSNNNHDVWLFEARATNERVQHRLLDGGNDRSFWDFSLDEQALIDLPLCIDFVLKKTGAPKLAYVAYSQSTSMMFALLSMRPEYSEKVAAFIALAPVVFTTHFRGALIPATLAKTYFWTSFSHAQPVLPEWYRRATNFVVTYMCSISFIKNTLCRNLWNLFAGKDKGAELEGGVVEDVLKSTSLKTFEQYTTNSMHGDFRMYDYKDDMRNIEEYGQTVPPQYNISKITNPFISLFRGTSDYLSDPEDQMILLSRLTVPLYEDHILEGYSHIDFIVSPNIVRDVNEPILRIIDKLTNRTVTRVSHTLGSPNPQVVGTQLVLDAKKEIEQVKGTTRSHVKTGSSDKTAEQVIKEAERPKDGVAPSRYGEDVRSQLFGMSKGGSNGGTASATSSASTTGPGAGGAASASTSASKNSSS